MIGAYDGRHQGCSNPLWNWLCQNGTPFNMGKLCQESGMKRRSKVNLNAPVWVAFVLCAPMLCAQQGTLSVSNDPSNAAPLTLTLQDALARARANEPQSRAALTQYGVARQQTVQARAGLLPNVNYNAEFLYTQGN